MDSIPEVIITSGSMCSAFQADNANLLTSYPTIGEISPKTLCLIGEDYLIGAVPRQPLIKVWTVSKMRKEEVGKFIIPGVVSALTVSSCGIYCVAGIKENIYIWQVTTGELLNVICRHYQDVSCLKFTGDDSRILSGGKDGHVMVWILAQAIAAHRHTDVTKPHFVWNNHSAEVTDIYNGSLSSRVATVSLDMTCKIYELDSGILLSAVCMDSPLTAVVMDPLEYIIFLGDDKGNLYKIDTYERLPREIHSIEVKSQFRIHQKKIISLSFSFEGTKLLTASEDGTCKLWDAQSMACVFSITVQGNFTNAFLAMKSEGMSVGKVLPQFYIRPFMKEFSRESSVRKFIESSIRTKTLSLMQEDQPGEIFSENLVNSALKIADVVNASVYEDLFQESVYGESVAELRTLNNQLYSFIINRGLDSIKEQSH
ncbi:WD repeat-containing protein 18 [Nephila pilipes]|uniref:WD repeat-containing protein 18 n=2 Tax=Nephila pilipes TaxID=299642 RepID=A0A8X6QPP4_NEPPI|nr:WD repeat-containing protein 18 [Nephila pilipes]